MNLKRREALRLTAVIGLMAATGLISQAEASEWNKAAFDGKSLDDVLKSLGGSSQANLQALLSMLQISLRMVQLFQLALQQHFLRHSRSRSWLRRTQAPWLLSSC